MCVVLLCSMCCRLWAFNARNLMKEHLVETVRWKWLIICFPLCVCMAGAFKPRHVRSLPPFAIRLRYPKAHLANIRFASFAPKRSLAPTPMRCVATTEKKLFAQNTRTNRNKTGDALDQHTNRCCLKSIVETQNKSSVSSAIVQFDANPCAKRHYTCIGCMQRIPEICFEFLLGQRWQYKDCNCTVCCRRNRPVVCSCKRRKHFWLGNWRRRTIAGNTGTHSSCTMAFNLMELPSVLDRRSAFPTANPTETNPVFLPLFLSFSFSLFLSFPLSIHCGADDVCHGMDAIRRVRRVRRATQPPHS